MIMQAAVFAALLSTAAFAQPYEHLSVEGHAPSLVTAESTTQPARQTLAEIVPADWQVFVEPGVQLPKDVSVEGNASWLDNLDRIGAAGNVRVVVDAHNKRVTVLSEPKFVR